MTDISISEYLIPKIKLPDDISAPTLIDIDEGAFRFAVSRRDSVSKIPKDKWEKSGTYVLLDDRDATGAYKSYVGVATKNVRSRVRTHSNDGTKPWWRVAILVRSDREYFTASHAQWLEARLIEEFDNIAKALSENGRPEELVPIPEDDVRRLEILVAYFLPQVLWLLGYDDSEAREGEQEKGTETYGAYKAVKLGDLYNDGFLKDGYRLVFKSANYNPQIEVVSGGKLKLEGSDKRFTSPLKAFQEHRRLREPGVKPTGYGGAWWNWDVDALDTNEKLENLEDMKKRYCRKNKIPIPKSKQ